jgi:hypothetical protein
VAADHGGLSAADTRLGLTSAHRIDRERQTRDPSRPTVNVKPAVARCDRL